MDLMDFFDIYNVKHLAAYKHLTIHGTWPEGFIPENCELSPIWYYQLAEKMAVAYVELGTSGKILGMPVADN
jgi:hypothetical protein